VHLSVKHKNYLRIKGWKIIFQANGPKKQAGVVIQKSNKIDFQPKVIKTDKKGHFVLINGKIYQKEFSVLNIYAPKGKGTHIHKRNVTKAQSTHYLTQ
jgi:exonuclease III